MSFFSSFYVVSFVFFCQVRVWLGMALATADDGLALDLFPMSRPEQVGGRRGCWVSVPWLVDWSVGRSVDWLVGDRLVGWLIDWLIHGFTY